MKDLTIRRHARLFVLNIKEGQTTTYLYVVPVLIHAHVRNIAMLYNLILSFLLNIYYY